MDFGLTIGEALAEFRRTHVAETTSQSRRTWNCRLGPILLTLPNFSWRREALPTHDLHHILTGYPCSMRGEFQLAAWEFAAGPFPHPAATLTCLPLVAAGMLWSPGAIWKAFRSGRRARSLHGTKLTHTFLQLPLSKLSAGQSRERRRRTRFSDRVAFAVLVAKSGLVVLIPVSAVIVAFEF